MLLNYLEPFDDFTAGPFVWIILLAQREPFILYLRLTYNKNMSSFCSCIFIDLLLRHRSSITPFKYGFFDWLTFRSFIYFFFIWPAYSSLLLWVFFFWLMNLFRLGKWWKGVCESWKSCDGSAAFCLNLSKTTAIMGSLKKKKKKKSAKNCNDVHKATIWCFSGQNRTH